MRFYRYSPNGQQGAWTLEVGSSFVVCVGFSRELRGIDVVYGERMWTLGR